MCDKEDTMRKTKNTKTMTEVLRQAITDSGLPLLPLSKATGIARASLIRFTRGETSLRLDVADRLATYFRLELNVKD
jgi:plasmid maintenance system antidote protein VapI